MYVAPVYQFIAVELKYIWEVSANPEALPKGRSLHHV